jgi:hypothetical protein
MFFRNIADTQRTTRRYIPEDGTFRNHRCENRKSYMGNVLVHERYSFLQNSLIPYPVLFPWGEHRAIYHKQ